MSEAPGAEPGKRSPVYYREDKSSAAGRSVELAKLFGFGLFVGLAVAGKIINDGRFFVMFMIPGFVIVFIFGLFDSGVGGEGYTGIQVTPEGVAAALPEIRRADSMFWYARQNGDGFHQELWIPPTRRPAELRQVLAAAAEAGLLRPDPR